VNKVLPWLKSNWLIVVLSLIILAVLPTALVIASGMNTKLREEVQQRAQGDANALSNPNVNYRIVSPIPGVADVELQHAANRAAIDWFKARREQVQAEAADVWAAALAFNKGKHELLMEGIFPTPPAGADDRIVRNDFTRLVVQKVPVQLLTTLNAGTPPDPTKLAEDILEHGYRRQEQLIAQIGGPLNKEQGEDLKNELINIRIENYRRRAGDIDVYADISSFPDIPPDMPVNAPSLEYCWEWQEAVWALEDFVAAVAAANAQVPGRTPGVPGSVVKRLIRVKVSEPPSRGGGDEEGSYRSSSGSGSSGGMIPTDPTVSVTGRISGPNTGNDLYDVRLIEAELIISTRHLPLFIDALAATNYMTVLDLDLERVEPLEHLADGYFYGDGEHVVKARMVIETLWFREWVGPHMPPRIRAARGLSSNAGEDSPE